MNKIKVLFVCLGNICRSPLAEAILEAKISQKKLSSRFEVDSCGTANYHIGSAPDERTIASASRNGIKIDHYCRQLTAADLGHYDHIIAMDQSNLQDIMKLLPNGGTSKKVVLMRDFDPLGKGKSVPDPYYGDEDLFQEVFEILDRSIDHFLLELEGELQE